MKSNIYQFSVNLGTLQSQEQQDEFLYLFMRDIFPYYTLKSITSTIQLASVVPILLQLSLSCLLPQELTCSANLFSEICGYLAKSVVFLRLASEYQYRLGFKHFLLISISVLALHLLGSLLIGLTTHQLLQANTSLLSICVLSIIDFNKLKETDLAQFEQEEKVQNYDLLDLNDTVIKLKNRQSSFTYDSYTNKEFYSHYLPSHPRQKHHHKKSSKGTVKTSSTFSHLIGQPLTSSQSQNLEVKIYKLILFNFIMFGHQSFHQFAVFLMAEGMVYLLVSTRFTRKLFD